VNFHERVIATTTGSIAVLVCEGCGALLLHRAEDLNTHSTFHDNLARAAKQADYADTMTRPIGGHHT